MKVLLFCFLLINSLMASEYYAKLEPFENYKVKSSVSGKVTFSNEKIEIEGFGREESRILSLK